ncbi:MAG: DUF1805 domain-containing protein [Promethearchaeota archaeon]
MPSRVLVRNFPIEGTNYFAQGIEASWEGGQWVAIICDKGMISCGAFDVELMEKHNQCIAVAYGSADKHLVTCEDLLNARIQGITKLARELGIKEGMTGREAIKILF